MRFACWMLALTACFACEAPGFENGEEPGELLAAEAEVSTRPLVEDILDRAIAHYGGSEWFDGLRGTRRTGSGRHLPDVLGRPGPHAVRFVVELSFEESLTERIEYPDVPFTIEGEFGRLGGRQTINGEVSERPISPDEAAERLRKSMLSHPVTALVFFHARRARLAEPELLDLVLGRQAWRLRLIDDDLRGSDLWIDPDSGRVLRCEYRVASQRWGSGRFEIEFPREVKQGEAPGPPRILTYREGERIQEVDLEEVTWLRAGPEGSGAVD